MEFLQTMRCRCSLIRKMETECCFRDGSRYRSRDLEARLSRFHEQVVVLPCRTRAGGVIDASSPTRLGRRGRMLYGP